MNKKILSNFDKASLHSMLNMLNDIKYQAERKSIDNESGEIIDENIYEMMFLCDEIINNIYGLFYFNSKAL